MKIIYTGSNNLLHSAYFNHSCLVILTGFPDSMTEVIDQADGSKMYKCIECSRIYKHRGTLNHHLRYECGKNAQFHCRFCPYKAKQKGNLKRHMLFLHRVENVYE